MVVKNMVNYNSSFFAIFLSAFLMLAGGASAATLTVNGDGSANYTTIQTAIDAANNGDTILVYSGPYAENVDVNIPLTLRGVDNGGGIPVVNGGGSDGIILSADGITLDGFRITNADNGIYLKSSNNTVKNNIVDNSVSPNNVGIHLENSNKNTITNNTANSNIDYGILLDSSSNNKLTGNTANSNTDTGIQLFNSSNNALANNIANSNTIGIDLQFSSNNSLTNNTVTSNIEGIYLESSSNYNTVTNNILISNIDTGIWLDASNNNTVINNTIKLSDYGMYVEPYSVSGDIGDIYRGNTITNINYHNGISIDDFYVDIHNITIEGNTISSSTPYNDGIYLYANYNIYNVTIKNNIISDASNDAGILLDNNGTSIYDVKVIGNTISNSVYGIYLNSADENILADNNASSNYDGIYLSTSSSNTLTNNVANNNTDAGIYFYYSFSNTLTGNTVNGNVNGIIFISSSFNNIGASVTVPETSFRWVDVNPSTARTSGSGASITDYGNYIMQADDDSFTYKLPFAFPFRGRSITNLSVNTNGLIELLETGETCALCSDYGTHANNNHIGTVDAIFASNDDLTTAPETSSGNNYLGVFNFGNKIVVEWNGSTLVDNNSVTNPVWFQAVLYPDGTMEWNFKSMEFSSYSYDMFSGAYAMPENLEYIAGYSIGSHRSFGTDLSVTAISTSDNIISNNTDDGIYLDSSDFNIISYCNITGSANGTFLTSSDNNTIFNNYFNNTNNAFDNGNNFWNSTRTLGTNIVGGPYIGGNVWSDFPGNYTGYGLVYSPAPYNSSGGISVGGDYLPLLTTLGTSLSGYINTTNGTVTTPIIITLPDVNITITVPAGTVASNASGGVLTSITTTPLDSLSPSAQNAATAANLSFVGKNLTIGPEGANVSAPIMVRINYTDDDLLAAGVSEGSLVVGWYDNVSRTWKILPIITSNPAGNYIIANVSNFGTIALLGTAGSTPTPTPTPTPIPGGTGSSGGSSGGGGTGGGGIVTAEPYDNIALYESYDKFLVANTPVTYTFKTPELGVYEVALTGKVNEDSIALRVESLKGPSKQAKTQPPGMVFKNVNIIVATQKMKEALIRFKVANSWLGSNNLAGSDVQMLRWDGSQWTQLDTAQTTKDDTYTYFEAKTAKFSPFAISAIKGVAAAVPTETPTGVVTATQVVPTVTPAPSATNKVPGIGFTLAVALISVAYLFGRKRR
ncbi:MAG: right-handed parallel beta-helix repeat-containing protein [Candidatus Methanoperedens sp.]|nr:right-handed parallel beta-helix repeat-containing protein [Candidatus Methanoperedens sp.]